MRKAAIALAFAYFMPSARRSIVRPSVNYMVEPIGISSDAIRFGWQMESNVIGIGQSAYRIYVYKDGELIWDSGMVESGLSVGIPYEGPKLENASRYNWIVTVRDNKGGSSQSVESYFETAVDGDPNWEMAEFIRMPESPAAPIFRTEKKIEGEVISARLYITAMGVYSAQINGQELYKTENGERVYHHMNPGCGNGERVYHHMNPGCGNADSSIEYETYDVTPMLKNQSSAVVTITAGTGWNGGGMGSASGRPAVKAMLTVTTDKGVQKIVTNTTDWKGTLDGPVTANGIYYGEDFDARKLSALGAYQLPGYDDSAWTSAAMSEKTPYSSLCLSSAEYAGELRPSRGMSGRIVDEFEQRPVTAVLYTAAKASSDYPGGEIDIDAEYDGADMFKDGITIKDGQTMVVNMGQNLTAVPEIKFSAERGVRLNIKFAEMLNDGSPVGGGATQASGPKGSIYTKSLRGARSEADYTFAGNGIEVYRPSMSFFGYQYVELKAIGGNVTITGLRSRALSSVSRRTGFIETNNRNVNRLFLNAIYGQLSNFFTIPTDCPQRDERLAWTGDAQAFAATAMYNFDSAAFLGAYQELLSDNTLRDGYPSAVLSLSDYFSHWASGWSDVEVINAYAVYKQTGDKNFLRDNWAALNAYMDFLKRNERAPCQAPNAHKWAYGDWLAFQGTSYTVIADCYYGYVTSLMAEMASELGDAERAAYYGEYFEKQRQTFLDSLVMYLKERHFTIKSSEGGYDGLFMADAGKAGVVEDNSQTSLIWMLKLGWYSDEAMKSEAVDMLVENIKNENPDPSSVRARYGKNTLSVGFLGSNAITPVLSDAGRADVSYDLLLSDSMPSWLFEVKAGATTIWERWNSYDPENGFGDAEMNSFNHFAYGSVAEWMYRYMAGIDHGNGFKSFVLQPVTDKGKMYNGEERIRRVNCIYDSCYGRIESGWEADDNGSLITYRAVVPANTEATLYLPVSAESMDGFENIPGVNYLGMEEHNGILTAKLALKSGGYEFKAKGGKISASLSEGYEERSEFL